MEGIQKFLRIPWQRNGVAYINGIQLDRKLSIELERILAVRISEGIALSPGDPKQRRISFICQGGQSFCPRFYVMRSPLHSMKGETGPLFRHQASLSILEFKKSLRVAWHPNSISIKFTFLEWKKIRFLKYPTVICTKRSIFHIKIRVFSKRGYVNFIPSKNIDELSIDAVHILWRMPNQPVGTNIQHEATFKNRSIKLRQRHNQGSL